MDDAISAVLADIKTSLGTTPLYFSQHTLNKQAPAVPYALLQPVSRPADPLNRYRVQSAAIFGLNVWGTQATCLRIERDLAWLERAERGNYNTSHNLRYSLWTRTFTREDWLINGQYEAWNLSTTYRCEYENFALTGGAA